MTTPVPDVDVHTGQLTADGLRIAIVASRFNEAVVDRLVDGAVDTLVRHGADPAGTVDAIIALGAVVRGQTPHFDYVAGEAASGCAAVQQEFGLPVAFGVLTTDDWEQAQARAGGKFGNKGGEAALAAIETANLLKDLAGR